MLYLNFSAQCHFRTAISSSFAFYFHSFLSILIFFLNTIRVAESTAFKVVRKLIGLLQMCDERAEPCTLAIGGSKIL